MDEKKWPHGSKFKFCYELSDGSEVWKDTTKIVVTHPTLGLRMLCSLDFFPEDHHAEIIEKELLCQEQKNEEEKRKKKFLGLLAKERLEWGLGG